MLIEASDLADRLESTTILDATVELPSPRFDGDYRLASGYQKWLEAHIPGSHHADLVEALSVEDPVCSFSHPPPDRLARALEKLGVDDAIGTVIYDSTDGFWAARLWWMLREIGIDAEVLNGGFRAWQNAGLPIAEGAVAPPKRGRITVKHRPDAWATLEQVAAVSRHETPGTLVCALPKTGFAGTTPTRYRRRGHIPGSLNLPARDLLDKAGRFKDKAALTEIVDQALGPAEGPVLLYCGGGISAALDALALTLIGRSDVVIYDGSLQEWSARPDLPLVLLEEPAR
jgi:thiosulfate/3-mercaptopyruvate sulfurtransferase